MGWRRGCRKEKGRKEGKKVAGSLSHIPWPAFHSPCRKRCYTAEDCEGTWVSTGRASLELKDWGGTERRSGPFCLPVQNGNSSDFLCFEALGASCSTSLILDMSDPMCGALAKQWKWASKWAPKTERQRQLLKGHEKTHSTGDLQKDLRAFTGMEEARLACRWKLSCKLTFA